MTDVQRFNACRGYNSRMGTYWLDTVIAAYLVLLLIAERQTTRRLVTLAFGLPLVVVLWLTRKRRQLHRRLHAGRVDG